MTGQIWNDVVVVASRIARQPRDAARLANLALAATAGGRKGLRSASRRASILDSVALQQAVSDIALYPLPKLSRKSSAWDELARRANQLSMKLDDPAAFDEWIESWQAFDPGRKTRGAYGTPSGFAMALANATLTPLLRHRGNLTIVDPSAGAGALLLAAYRVLAQGKSQENRRRLLKALYGIELDPATRELCCLVLWLVGGMSRNDLDDIARNIVVGDALARNWWADSKQGPRFHALLMNPPWESLRHSVSSRDPMRAVHRLTIQRLSREEAGSACLPSLYSAQGRGDRNLAKAFIELAPHLLRQGGRYGALLPGAFASDLGMSALRERYLQQLDIERWTGFENLRRHFLIDSRYKFGLLIGRRSNLGTKTIRIRSFATVPEEISADHAPMSIDELSHIGGPSRMIPELGNQTEKDMLVRALSRGTPFFDRGSLGQVSYHRELDLTMDLRAGLFYRFEDRPGLTTLENGLFRDKDGNLFVPVMEGRMVGQYDFFQKSWIAGRGRTAQWAMNDQRLLTGCTPQFVSSPSLAQSVARIAICDVTSATNTRTVHATWVPNYWRCGNTAPVLRFSTAGKALAALGILNSMVFDWIARRIVGGLHLNKFYLAALAWPRLSEADQLFIANAAAFLCWRNPRFTPAGGNAFLQAAGISRKDTFDPVDALSLIEGAVARGFGLEPFMLSQLFSSSKHDRRGFWRAFESDPLALPVVERALAANA